MQNNAPRPKRSPLRVGITTGILIVVAVGLAVFSTHFNIDQRFFIMALLLLVGVLVLSQVIRRNPQNAQEAKDETETCLPIMESYRKHKSIDKLMNDYTEWKSGDHTTYTRMHFAEKIIDELRNAEQYERALQVLYEVGTLPFKARDHYDYDNYRAKCEAELLEAIKNQKK